MGPRQRCGFRLVILSGVILCLANGPFAAGQEGFSEPPLFQRNLNDTLDGIGPCVPNHPLYEYNCVDPDGDGPLEWGDGHQWNSNQQGIAFDSQGNYYVAHYLRQEIRKFDGHDRMVLKWPITGLYFNDSFDVAVDSQDNVWVATRRDGVLKKYDTDGNPLPGSIDLGPLARTNGMHIDERDRIFVALDGPFFGEVRRYDNGSHALTIYPIVGPQNIATDSQGNIWVTAGDFYIDPGRTVKKYDPDGQFIQSFYLGSVPWEIHIDDHDRVYLSMVYMAGWIDVRDSEFNLLFSFGSPGTGDGEFSSPSRVAFTPSGNTIYVNDRVNARFVVFSSTEGMIDNLIEEIEGLIDDGSLNGGQGHALIAKLEAALTKLLDDKTNTAINQLGAFRNQVEAFIQSGELTPEEGQALLDAVDAVVEALGG